MSTPIDAPYKVKQRDLRGLLRAPFPSTSGFRERFCMVAVCLIAKPPRAPTVWVPQPTATGRFGIFR